jgi:hypothetical protein
LCVWDGWHGMGRSGEERGGSVCSLSLHAGPRCLQRKTWSRVLLIGTRKTCPEQARMGARVVQRDKHTGEWTCLARSARGRAPVGGRSVSLCREREQVSLGTRPFTVPESCLEGAGGRGAGTALWLSARPSLLFVTWRLGETGVGEMGARWTGTAWQSPGTSLASFCETCLPGTAALVGWVGFMVSARKGLGRSGRSGRSAV